MTKEYKNPFEDPEAEFYGKKVKDYKIPKRRKEEPKPAEPLEKKVEPNPYVLMFRYEKEMGKLREEKRESKNAIAIGYGIALVFYGISLLVCKNYSDPLAQSFARLPFIFFCGIPAAVGSLAVGATIRYAKKIKGLEKKIKEIKK